MPLGGGKIFHFGKLPVNTQLSACYNVVKQDDAANWRIRFRVQFMFPKIGRGARADPVQAACSTRRGCLAIPMRLMPLTSARIDAVTMLPSIPTP